MNSAHSNRCVYTRLRECRRKVSGVVTSRLRYIFNMLNTTLILYILSIEPQRNFVVLSYWNRRLSPQASRVPMVTSDLRGIQHVISFASDSEYTDVHTYKYSRECRKKYRVIVAKFGIFRRGCREWIIINHRGKIESLDKRWNGQRRERVCVCANEEKQTTAWRLVSLCISYNIFIFKMI